MKNAIEKVKNRIKKYLQNQYNLPSNLLVFSYFFYITYTFKLTLFHIDFWVLLVYPLVFFAMETCKDRRATELLIKNRIKRMNDYEN